MYTLTREKQIQVLRCLTEGMSLRATVRMTGVARNTVSKLLLEIGDAYEQYHFEHVRNLKTVRAEVDEIWAFVYAKDKNLPEELRNIDGYGSVWTWTAIDADSKLMISWLVGGRDATYAKFFMEDVADKLSNRIQLTSDGHKPYIEAVKNAFGNNIDYAQLVKLYGNPPGEGGKYSPGEVNGIKKKKIIGQPVKALVSTSYAERQNLTMRMQMRRFTRLTNAFSKKLEYLRASVSLYFMHYNFVRIHQTLKMTPAQKAGLTDRAWSYEDLIDLVERYRFEAQLQKNSSN